MQGAILYGPRDVRFEERDAPTIIKPTDAIISDFSHLRLRVRPMALPRHQLRGRRFPTTLIRAMDNGLTQEQAAEVITHLAFYAGWPNEFSALPVAKQVFEKRPQ